ncbi:AmmeMemoRadiSam system protein A [Clostridium gasigenes]|uniref:AmmeMemoRadiSam system protein A n=1 Tax=Clostridium gasigenes TaxID=94869 RepID=UPI001C0C9404|nr:AmmeMemoRadiSam system protein A [Clostridium gasigenes]MBU3135389.1 AmmeMemoRadiSam system protein A [Clostridium gasigenes]
MLNYFLMPHPPIIIPEVGRGEENKVIKTVNACKAVGEKIDNLDAETIIIISPHGVVFRDAIAIVTSNYIKGDLGKFGAEEVSFNYEIDLELTNKIIDCAKESNVLVANLDEKTTPRYNVPLELDHGAIVPLYYADKSRNHKLVHITYGLLSPIELLKFGLAIKRAVKETNKKAVLIASGDLSHRLTRNGPYDYTPLGATFDNTLIDILLSGNLKDLFNIEKRLINEAGECGLRSLYILAGAINTTIIKSKLLSYEGPLGVGYGTLEFKEGEGNLYEDIIKDKKNEHKRRLSEGNKYTKLARTNLDRYFNEGRLITIDELTDNSLLDHEKGVFVSLKINGELRGCIGTIQPTTSCVGEEIIRNSLSAALDDPRFQPLKKDELIDIDISVDLLYPAESTLFDELDPLDYGVIVTCGDKRGLLLPNIEGIDTKEQQVEIAMSKGNISLSDTYTLERFKVERFKELDNDE